MRDFVVLGAALACTALIVALIVWWMRHVPSRTLESLKSRGEVAEVPEEFDTQPRNPFDQHVDGAVLLTHEVRDDEESNDTAADFLLWEDEYARRMDRWSQ